MPLEALRTGEERTMKRLLTLLLAAAAISGCSTFKGRELSGIEPTRPQVYVTADNRLVVPDSTGKGASPSTSWTSYCNRTETR
jgi:hypothetical protein